MFGKDDPVNESNAKLTKINQRLETLARRQEDDRTYALEVARSVNSLAEHMDKQIAKVAETSDENFRRLQTIIRDHLDKNVVRDQRIRILELSARMDDVESYQDVIDRAAQLEHLVNGGFPPSPEYDAREKYDAAEDAEEMKREAETHLYVEHEGVCVICGRTRPVPVHHDLEDLPDICTENAMDGKKCLKDAGHEGRHVSHLATPENVAKCLAPDPDEPRNKCQKKMGHAGDHWAPDAEPDEPLIGEAKMSPKFEATVNKAADADPLRDMQRMAQQFEENNGVPADTVGVGPDLIEHFASNTKGPIGRRIQQRIEDGAITMESLHDPNTDAIIGYVWHHRPSELTSAVVDNPVGTEAMNALGDLRKRIERWEKTKADVAELRKEVESREEPKQCRNKRYASQADHTGTQCMRTRNHWGPCDYRQPDPLLPCKCLPDPEIDNYCPQHGNPTMPGGDCK